MEHGSIAIGYNHRNNGVNKDLNKDGDDKNFEKNTIGYRIY